MTAKRAAAYCGGGLLLLAGLSYGGSATIRELQDNVEFVEITSHGYRESLAHGKL